MRPTQFSARIFIVLLALALGLAACGDPTATPVPPTATTVPTKIPTTAPPTTLAVTTTAPAVSVQFQKLPATPTIDSESMTIGSPQAQITLLKYTDFRCPACKNNFDQTEALILNQYVNTGKIKFTLRTYPVIDKIIGDSDSQLGGQALLCSADQKRAWDYHDLAYNNFVGKVSGKLTAPYLKEMGLALKLDTAQFNSCLDSGKYRQAVIDQAAQGERLGVSGTPTFVLKYKGGENLIKGNTFDALKAEIDKAMLQLVG